MRLMRVTMISTIENPSKVEGFVQSVAKTTGAEYRGSQPMGGTLEYYVYGTDDQLQEIVSLLEHVPGLLFGEDLRLH